MIYKIIALLQGVLGLIFYMCCMWSMFLDKYQESTAYGVASIASLLIMYLVEREYKANHG